MKNILSFSAILILIFSLQSCIVSHRPNMEFVKKSPGMEVMSVNVPTFLAKPFVKKALREDGDEALIPLIKKISDIKVMMVSNVKQNMQTDFANFLNRNNFEEWMSVKKEKEVINFHAKQTGDEIRNLLIAVVSGTEMIYVDVTGKFTADDISRVINFSEKNDVRKMVSQ
ncbi:DUF4252 domain-containing protein [Chryseobacterium suipulveris]|uniref:DUF4252 domain-containing protein n=1 Tax=Chryseobacterium suipulveris TaxID=2929800 RepID=A0ABY4BQZ9_9FLAO|nr:DUF4252 domain-containing protein [Chryseobacterium suipulveris]UOE41632.1 DUF4252 domain-containing protein [Chryseobacterium suipulveris]